VSDNTKIEMQRVADFIFEGNLLSADDLKSFRSILTRKFYKKGSYLISPGEKAEKFFIVKEGIIRNFLICKESKEHTKVFHGPGGLLGSYSEYLANRETLYYIEAVSNTTVDSFLMEDLVELIGESASWLKVQKILAEASFLDKEERKYRNN